MRNPDDDLDRWTKWSSQNFENLKELFRHEVAAHVLKKQITIGTGLMTVLAILSYFGIREAVDIALNQVVIDAKEEVTKEFRTAVESELNSSRQVRADVQSQVDVTQQFLNWIRQEVDRSKHAFDRSMDEAEANFAYLKGSQEESLEDLQDNLQSFQSEFAAERTKIDWHRELTEITVCDSKELLRRIEGARRGLDTVDRAQRDQHRLVLARCVKELGQRDFKGGELDTKDQAIELLVDLLRRPSDVDVGQSSLEGKRYRTVRTNCIVALKNLGGSTPRTSLAVERMTSMLASPDKFHERDGAAWGLRLLADDNTLTEFAEPIVERAVEQLIDCALSDQEIEVPRVALTTLESIAGASEFAYIAIDDGVSERIRRGLHSPDLDLRLRSTKVVAALGQESGEEWVDALFQLVEEDEDDRVQAIAASSLTRSATEEFANLVETRPDLNEKLAVQAKEARDRSQKDARATALRTLRASRRHEFESGRWSEALEAVNQLIALEPDNAHHKRDLMEMLVITGSYEEARTLVAELRTLDDASEWEVLYDLFDVIALIIGGKPHEAEKARFLSSAERMKDENRSLGGWRFSIFEEFIREKTNLDDASRGEILELVDLADRKVPDLMFEDWSWEPREPVRGEPLAVRVAVSNSGSADSGPFTVEWWAGMGLESPAKTWTVNGLAPGERRELTFEYAGFVKAGIQRCKFAIDPDQSVGEVNRLNNTSFRTIRVGEAQ